MTVTTITIILTSIICVEGFAILVILPTVEMIQDYRRNKKGNTKCSP